MAYLVLDVEDEGEFAGCFQTRVGCRRSRPESLPKEGVILVGKQFGRRTGYYSHNAVFDGGRYGYVAGDHADLAVFQDGYFDPGAGYGAKQRIVHRGTFKEKKFWEPRDVVRNASILVEPDEKNPKTWHVVPKIDQSVRR